MHTSTARTSWTSSPKPSSHARLRRPTDTARESRPVVTDRDCPPLSGARTGPWRRRDVYRLTRTHHGPIVRSGGRQVDCLRLMDRPVPAPSQSFLRTKRRTSPDIPKVMALQANSSNNTVFADAEGDIAYFHPQFVPLRDDRFDWIATRRRQRSCHRLEPLARPRQTARTWCRPAERLDPRTRILALDLRRRADSPERQISPRTWTRSAKAHGDSRDAGAGRHGTTSPRSG